MVRVGSRLKRTLILAHTAKNGHCDCYGRFGYERDEQFVVLV